MSWNCLVLESLSSSNGLIFKVFCIFVSTIHFVMFIILITEYVFKIDIVYKFITSLLSETFHRMLNKIVNNASAYDLNTFLTGILTMAAR